LYFVRELAGAFRNPWTGRSAPELWRMPAQGGFEEKVIAGVHPGFWGVAENGIYFVQPPASPGLGLISGKLVRVSESSPSDRQVLGTMERPMEEDSIAFAVSGDGRSVLFALHARLESDLFLVNDFR
jgi:hypothetical protein